MYKFIRNFHLAMGLIITPFLLVYALSSAFYSHRILDFSSAETKIEEFSIVASSKNPTELADFLIKNHGIRGTLDSSSLDDSGFMTLMISRPGNHYKIVVDTNSGIVTSQEKTKDAVGFIASLHHAGFRYKNADEAWWSFAMTLVSVLMILVVVTGIILWVYRTRDRISGSIFLSVSAIYAITVLCVLRLG